MALKGLDNGLIRGPGIILAIEARESVDGRLVLRGDPGCLRVTLGVRGSLIWASVGKRGVDIVLSRPRGRESWSWEDCQGFLRSADEDGGVS